MTLDSKTPVVLPVYAPSRLGFARGEGVYLFGLDGKKYLDFATGYAVCGLGHNHPRLVAALKAQADKLWHVSNAYWIPEKEQLAQRLVDNSFAASVFFCNSGAEAMEGCFKAARRFHYKQGAPQRQKFITFSGAFHGRTLACIAATGNPAYLEGYGDPVAGFVQIPFADKTALERTLDDSVAAVVLEPVQGEGGVRPFPLEFLRYVRDLTKARGALLLLDEIQIGVGRSGKLFAHSWAGIEPDLMAIAKGLGGGFPIGAVLLSAPCAQAMTLGSHGTTFGGNPLACAVANAVLDEILAPNFLDTVDKQARLFWRGLVALVTRYPQHFSEARGAGLLVGLRCHASPKLWKEKLETLGLLCMVAGDNMLRFLPPLIITPDDVNAALAIIEQAAQTFPASR